MILGEVATSATTAFRLDLRKKAAKRIHLFSLVILLFSHFYLSLCIASKMCTNEMAPSILSDNDQQFSLDFPIHYHWWHLDKRPRRGAVFLVYFNHSTSRHQCNHSVNDCSLFDENQIRLWWTATPRGRFQNVRNTYLKEWTGSAITKKPDLLSTCGNSLWYFYARDICGKSHKSSSPYWKIKCQFLLITYKCNFEPFDTEYRGTIFMVTVKAANGLVIFYQTHRKQQLTDSW